MADKLMYDSTTPHEIPSNALIVMGYIDGATDDRWTAADWKLFPKARRVECVRNSATDDGRVLDVEPGCVWPVSEAPRWVEMRRASKSHPLSGPAVVYVDYANWQETIDAFDAAKVQMPQWGVACYDNLADLNVFEIEGERRGPLGEVAFKQFRSTTVPNLDTSICSPSFP